MPTRDGPRLTLLQLMKIPVFVAVAMGCVVFAERFGLASRIGLIEAMLVQAIAIPACWAGLVLVMVRPGGCRDWLLDVTGIVALIGAGLGVLMLIAMNLAAIVDSLAEGHGLPIDLVALVIWLIGAAMALRVGLTVLVPRVVPQRCPRCRRRAGLPDEARSRVVGMPSRSVLFRCPACGCRWRGVDDEADEVEPIESIDLQTSALA